MRIPIAAIEAGAKALEDEHRIGNLEKSLSVLEAAMPAIREALAAEIEASVFPVGVGGPTRVTASARAHAARIVQGV